MTQQLAPLSDRNCWLGRVAFFVRVRDYLGWRGEMGNEKEPKKVRFEVKKSEGRWTIEYLDRSRIMGFGNDYRLCAEGEKPDSWVELEARWRVFDPHTPIGRSIYEAHFHEAAVTGPIEEESGCCVLHSVYERWLERPAYIHWREVARVLWHEEGVSIRIAWDAVPVEVSCALGRLLSGDLARNYLATAAVERVVERDRAKKRIEAAKGGE